MNGFDILALGILALMALLGARKGFLIRLVGLVVIAAGVVGVVVFRPPIAVALSGPLDSDSIAGIAAVPLAFLAGALPVGLIGRLVVRAIHATPLRAIDMLFGGAVGLLQGALIVALFLLPAAWLIPSYRATLQESRTYALVTDPDTPWYRMAANMGENSRSWLDDLGDRARDKASNIDLGAVAGQAGSALSTLRQALPDGDTMPDLNAVMENLQGQDGASDDAGAEDQEEGAR
jgi:uncharacterized membrane protein required for colicin V production